VRDLSFEVQPGQTLGIIGPTAREVDHAEAAHAHLRADAWLRSIRGRVGTLIEVSAGFHGDLTGRENVFLQGAIMGMRSQEIDAQFDEIVDFSGSVSSSTRRSSATRAA
jgi:lipopolysaccharide transport system ATP-binding protein